MRWLAAMAVPVLAAAFLAVATTRSAAHPPLSQKEMQLDRELAANPEDPELRMRRAVLYGKRASWDAAAAAYLRAMELGGDANRVDVGLAQVFLSAGFPLSAERKIEQVLARSPEQPLALVTRARVRKVLGKIQAAAEDLQRAVGRQVHPDPGLVLEAMDAQLAAGREVDALRIADAAMHKIGTIVSVQLPAIEIELELGHHEAALRRIDALLVQSPRHGSWLLRRAEILEDAGRTDEARAGYQTALSLLRERPARRRSEKTALLERRLSEKLAQVSKETPR